MNAAENMELILVCTGVYNHQTYDETSGRNHASRDMIMDLKLKILKHICEHVLHAVDLIFNIEQLD